MNEIILIKIIMAKINMNEIFMVKLTMAKL